MKANLDINRVAELAKQIAERENENFTFFVRGTIIEGCRNRKTSECYEYDLESDEYLMNTCKMGHLEDFIEEAIETATKELEVKEEPVEERVFKPAHMKTTEEIKQEITNNSYEVKLSNGQVVFVDKKTNERSVAVYIKNERSVYGFDKVVSGPRNADKEDLVERIKDCANHIIHKSIIDCASAQECNDAYNALNEEIANIMLND